jgi:hypothetical protein
MECNNTSPKSIEDYICEKMPNSAMAEQGPGTTFHSLEVPQQGVGLDY